jgi:hypothetical protein
MATPFLRRQLNMMLGHSLRFCDALTGLSGSIAAMPAVFCMPITWCINRIAGFNSFSDVQCMEAARDVFAIGLASGGLQQ